MPKCKHMKKVKFEGTTYCACKTGNPPWFSDYVGISRKFDLPVMGSENYHGKDGNWWSLCVGGKSRTSGITPSKCKYYS